MTRERPAVRVTNTEIRMIKGTESLRILARQNVLTNTDWFTLLEERRLLLAPHLRDMSLKALCDLKIVGVTGGRRRRPLRMGGVAQKFTKDIPYRPYREECTLDIVMEGDSVFDFDTRGIFPDDDVYYHGHFKGDFIREQGKVEAVGEVLKFWGLTRNNTWITVETTLRFISQPRDLIHYANFEMITWVERLVVHESTSAEICQFCEVTPRWLWQRLGDTVHAWVTHRNLLLSNAETLDETVRQEEMLVNIIAKQ
ncbi:MAG: hypothetical protein A3D67_01955 [Candidatus Lloydbacteria bacterium RIFCSPHIGHO2_02_FULL_51_22]|uniref:Uncharacterized protein n=1 Tax=Candidatus Lloydbacteria bacterium RIFCSPHIGHO2_02_FULL_51_22 TaxID=1798663 RepID=A0A1G2DAE1_9BACT|nr:MAG: hypothetical protein A3D67_01955 [Candidatus Lloydbacteria bacterium RIFCSPHIGHO2_02_FULL_51_22]